MEDFEQQKEGIFDLINSWDEKNIRIANLICENDPLLKAAVFDAFKELLAAKDYKSFSGLKLLANLNGVNSDSMKEEIQYLVKIRWLKINHTDFSLFPDFYLRDLVRLKISSGQLTELSPSIIQLKSLEVLDLEGCRSLCYLPTAIQQLNRLNRIVLTGTPIADKCGVNILNSTKDLLDFLK